MRGLTEMMPVNFQMIVQDNIEMWNLKYNPKQIYY